MLAQRTAAAATGQLDLFAATDPRGFHVVARRRERHRGGWFTEPPTTPHNKVHYGMKCKAGPSKWVVGGTRGTKQKY